MEEKCDELEHLQAEKEKLKAVGGDQTDSCFDLQPNSLLCKSVRWRRSAILSANRSKSSTQRPRPSRH